MNETAPCRIVGLTLVRRIAGAPLPSIRVQESGSSKQHFAGVDYLVTSISHLFGLQETRPDFITRYELRRLRDFGCTRVQIGVQHVDDDVLRYINRGCTRKDAIRAVRMLKDAGFKVGLAF